MSERGERGVVAAAEAGGNLSRRQVLSVLVLTGGALASGVGRAWPAPLGAGQGSGFPGGTLLGTVEFVGEGDPPMDTPVDTELDGRLMTDLATLPWDTRTVPTAHFYIRTRTSRRLAPKQSWTIRLGRDESAPVLTADRLHRDARPMGIQVLECSGNGKRRRFGLLSAAEWQGVPLVDVLDRLPKPAQPSRILVSGFDTYATHSTASTSGASWLFSQQEIEHAGAFLATGMNGAALPADHGAPVRLLVPGWYGCSCIKWVNQIAWAPEGTRATSQMREFAGRTGQAGTPVLAKDYVPAAMEPAAMPVRVERWQVDGAIKYLVVGILWGQARQVERLEIQFNANGPYVAVPTLEAARDHDWRFWSCPWSPAGPGEYAIRLRVAAPHVRTRRLDRGYYLRTVKIGNG